MKGIWNGFHNKQRMGTTWFRKESKKDKRKAAYRSQNTNGIAKEQTNRKPSAKQINENK